MNLYLRMIWLYLSAPFKSKIDILKPFTSRYVVFPNDLDLIGHMNNGRYFTIGDLARIEMFKRAQGLWERMIKKGFVPVLAGETAQFRKSLNVWDRYEVTTQILGWDKKYAYLEHCFQSRGDVCALLLVKVRMVGNQNLRMSPLEIFQLLDPEFAEETRMSLMLEHWNDYQHQHWDKNTVNRA